MYCMNGSQYLIYIETSQLRNNMVQSISLSALAVLALATGSNAFSTSMKKSSVLSSSTELHAVHSNSRKEFLQTIGVASMVLASPIMNNVAFAEDAVVVGEETAVSAGLLVQSPNLRSLKRAQKQLSKMEFYATENDYESLKVAIRNAPFSECRLKSFAILKEYKDQPAGIQEKLKASYDTFIASVEKMDNTAGLGMRGRSMSKDAMLKDYQTAAANMAAWIAAIESVSS